MGNKLKAPLVRELKECCKDKASFLRLKEIFGELKDKYESISQQLYLLEQAIRYDYDSILITELDLVEPGPKIVYVNDGFTKMTGYSKEEVIGKTPRILQGEKTDQEVLDRLKEKLIEGQAFFGHTINYRKDGSEFVNQWDIHPLTNDNGEITHWVSYQRDITDRKETSKLVFNTSLDFENLPEESKRTFVDLDVQGNFILANNAFKDTLGYDDDELKEIKIWELTQGKDSEEMRYFFADFDANSIEERPYPWEFMTKEGQPITLAGNVHHFVNKNKETVVRINFDNLTMRNRVIEALKKKKESLEKMLNQKDEFMFRFRRKENGTIHCQFVSEGYSEITGMNANAVREKGLEGAVHQEDIAKNKKALTDAFEGKKNSVRCKYKTAEGDYISVIQSFSPSYAESSAQVDSVKCVGMIELEVEN
ncbi:MAG: PAS domain S-box protein [Balneolaceae bacterium]|nr:PAS domain S-box protein [Balneolaceae bacterium]